MIPFPPHPTPDLWAFSLPLDPGSLEPYIQEVTTSTYCMLGAGGSEMIADSDSASALDELRGWLGKTQEQVWNLL